MVIMGVKKASINKLKPTDTIAYLIQRLVEKEGLDEREITSLIFRGNQLTDTNKQLQDVGIKARSQLMLSFRVNGGMAQDPGNEASEPTPRTRRFREKFHQLDPMKDGFKETKNNKCLNCLECSDLQTILTFKQCNKEEHALCVDCIYKMLKR